MKTKKVTKKVAAPAVAVERVTVRYSQEKANWAVVDPTDPSIVKKVLTEYPTYLTDVKFDSKIVTTRYGCGSNSTEIGLAEGVLSTERPAGLLDAVSDNLQFKDGKFCSRSETLTQARFVRLMPNRFATVYV